FTSPFVAKLLGDESGTISGKKALKSLFTKALEEYPDLKFELHDVLIGVNSLTLLYKSVNELLAAAVITLDSEGKIVKSILHFSIHASNTDN
ncbi:MAG: nuclear transport factor 2 family protein, partial [Deltaproteobacteria bacterium]|nr:nuclear transport factor 2 family protein [Deltaproteobacteria bacterium]